VILYYDEVVFNFQGAAFLIQRMPYKKHVPEPGYIRRELFVVITRSSSPGVEETSSGVKSKSSKFLSKASTPSELSSNPDELQSLAEPPLPLLNRYRRFKLSNCAHLLGYLALSDVSYPRSNLQKDILCTHLNFGVVGFEYSH
jgi:hypothetical protein